MKRRKILYLFPLAALVLSGCTFQEAVASLKSFLSNNVYHPAKDFIDGLSGKTSEEEGKEDQKPSGEEGKEDQKPSGEEGDKETPTTKHAGTLADPFDGEDAVAVANSLGAGKVSEDFYYIEGKVVSIEKEYDPQYGSYTFKIEGGFIAWQLKFGENKAKFAEGDIAVDDVVTMYAQIQLYGTENPVPETSGGYVTKVVKPTPAEELLSIEIQGNAQTSYIAGADYNHDGLSVVAHYDGAADQDVTKSVDWSISKEKAEVGDDEITISASFGGKTDSLVVHVTVSDNSGPQHAGTEADPYTGLDAYIVGDKLEAGGVTSEFFYIEGEVVSFEESFNANFGNYSFKMEGGFIGWRMLAGAKLEKFAEGDLKVGDVVTLYTKIQNYQGKPESKDGYIKTINGVEQGTPDTPIDPSTLTEKVVFELGENGEAAHADGSAATTYTETVSGVTLSITDGEKMYTGARDAAGNSCIKFATGSAAASFKIDISSVSGLKKVIFNIANYKANSGATIAINGNDPIAITGTSDAGEYDAVAFDITDEELLTVALPKRAMLNSIEFCPAEAPAIPVESVSIEEESLTLHIGGKNEKLSETLHATVLPEEATNKTVAWSIDGDCATIDAESGLVTAVKSGSATVTAAAGGQSDTCEVTVIKHVSGVEITESISVVAGEDSADPLQVTISPEGVTNDHFSLVSSDESVATVNEQGYVHGESAGTATITVTTEDGEFTDTCTVTVEAKVIAVESVARISEESQDLFIGDHVTLEAKVMPEDTTQSKALVWSLQSGDAVTVNAESGLVEAVKEGVAVVRATSVANSSAYVDFTVNVSKVAVESITLKVGESTVTEKEVTEGDEFDLVAVVSPENATFKDISWSSSDESVATVSESGHIVAVKDGQASITASADGKSASLALTVIAKPKPVHAGTVDDPYTASDVLLAYADMTSGAATEAIYVSGTIAADPAPVVASQRGRFYITDGENSVYVYNANNVNNQQNLTENDIPAGSQVVVTGAATIYNNALQIAYNGSASPKINCYIVSIVKPVITPTTVTISGANSVQEESTITLTATVGPAGAPQDVVWSVVSGSDKASVDASGVVTGIAEGSATIRATAADHADVYGDYAITVTAKPTTPTEQEVYKLDGTVTGGSSGYAEASDIVQGGIHWDVEGNTTMNPWRIGGKNLSGVDRTAKSQSVVTTDNLTKVEVKTGTKTLSAVNSITIKVGSTAGADDLGTKQFTTGLVSATLEFARPEGKTWSNAYITVVFNVNAAGSNQYIQLLAISLYAIK